MSHGNPAGKGGRSLVQRAALVLVTAWAGFWMWFAGSVGWSEGLLASPYPLTAVGLLASLVVVSWRHAKSGGLFLIVFAGFSAYLFRRGVPALLGVSLPALLLGLTLLVSARTPTARA